ncbi:hypothetical protein G6F70_001870 [Rhizopus microsporus]|uniref:ATP synthase subunit K, mitochondrial n=2 Tax=Rhizopus TaxID=4842 RepID=A0A367JML2_RHIAZ|nr:hypothetical protein G6F71_000969 [Rhizopus microsporus]RCH91167.1 hypothetical protein CU097_009512 [Rhizopus azygosporus]KAG1202895.1 hypothetical protein G6F70_001870 [Rhizopus microsporus]KAG1214543.1 hypothetical protein G6F69_001842 [Rhizopus microsporus]KAG1237747.1 hypothetical protein G6F67_000986 [Rhizopus microsporus]
MGGYYTIAGKQVPNHKIAMAFIGSYAAIGSYYIMKPKAPQPATPPIQASSADEEAFIREFLQKAEAEEKKN